jgi:hypothetical protein
MMGLHLTETYKALSELGLVRSKRHFSRVLGHHWSYLRDVEKRDNDAFRVPPVTVERLRVHLLALTGFLPSRSASEIEQVIGRIDQHTAVADHLGYRSRNFARSSANFLKPKMARPGREHTRKRGQRNLISSR